MESKIVVNNNNNNNNKNNLNVNDESSIGCDRHCANCRTTSTPLWRKFGPVKFLCNACGLYYKVNGDHRPYYMSKNKLNSIDKKSMLRCANCGTNKTTMWRKNGGLHVCNACGLYFRINGQNRPVTMRKDVIRTRRRRETSTYEIGENVLGDACDAQSNEPILSEIKREHDESDEYKKSCKMMFNIGSDSSTFVLSNEMDSVGSGSGLNRLHHNYHHHHQHQQLVHYQQICADVTLSNGQHSHSHHLPHIDHHETHHPNLNHCSNNSDHNYHHHHHTHHDNVNLPLPTTNQLVNPGPVDSVNAYYCPFF